MRQRCSSSESVLTYVAVAFRGGTLLINQRCLRSSFGSAATGTLWNWFFLGQQLLDSTPKLGNTWMTPTQKLKSAVAYLKCPVALMCPLLEFNLVFHINHLSSSFTYPLLFSIRQNSRFMVTTTSGCPLSVST